MYLKSAPGLYLRPEQGIKHSIKNSFFQETPEPNREPVTGTGVNRNWLNRKRNPLEAKVCSKWSFLTK